MRTLVLRVVADPAQVFWAPLMPAAANVLFNFAAMMAGIVLFDLNPIPFFVTTLVGHTAIAVISVREPHIATLVTAWMETRRKTANLVAVRGNKYVA
jgi:type IV secretory pathway VirB3-like protein